jgi:hypothetical protein
MAAVHPSKAFYYPHIEFASGAWVKCALLYWEGIARHVRGPTVDRDPEIRALAEAGLVEDVLVWPYWPKITPVFGERLERLLVERGEIPESVPGAGAIRGHTDEQIGTMQERVAVELEGAGCHRAAAEVRRNLQQSLSLYGAIAADIISRDLDLAPITDDTIFQAISTYFDEAKVALDPRSLQSGLACADLLVPAPSIDVVASLPVPRLIEVRDELASHRRAFREKVEAHVGAIATLPTVEAVDRQMKAFAREIEGDIEAERTALRRQRLDWAGSFLHVMAPASAAVGVAMMAAAPVAGPVALGAAALEATRWFIQRRDGHGGKRNYMLSVEEALGGRRHELQTGLDRLLGVR